MKGLSTTKNSALCLTERFSWRCCAACDALCEDSSDMHKQTRRIKCLASTTAALLAVSSVRGCLATCAIDRLKWVPATIGILWHEGKRGSARGAISGSQEHRGSDRQSTWRESERKEWGGAQIQKRGEDEGEVYIRRREGEGKRWSLPKWVVTPHLSIPWCHTPSPTPQEF